MHMCSAVTCPLHFWQNVRDLSSCYCGNTGMEWILKKEKKKKENEKKESAQKVDHGEENSPAAPAGTRTRELSITSPAL